MKRLALVLLLSFAGGAAARTIAEVKLLYFHARGCASCARLDAGKALDRLREAQPLLKIEVVDVDTQAPLLDKYGVTQTPTLLLVDQDGFPLGKVAVDLEKPEVTFERAQKLVKKMTR